MSAATRPVINACGSLLVTVAVELLSMLQALLQQVQALCKISQGFSGDRRAVCKQLVPRQQKGCLQAACA